MACSAQSSDSLFCCSAFSISSSSKESLFLSRPLVSALRIYWNPWGMCWVRARLFIHLLPSLNNSTSCLPCEFQELWDSFPCGKSGKRGFPVRMCLWPCIQCPTAHWVSSNEKVRAIATLRWLQRSRGFIKISNQKNRPSHITLRALLLWKHIWCPFPLNLLPESEPSLCYSYICFCIRIYCSQIFYMIFLAFS